MIEIALLIRSLNEIFHKYSSRLEEAGYDLILTPYETLESISPKTQKTKGSKRPAVYLAYDYATVGDIKFVDAIEPIHSRARQTSYTVNLTFMYPSDYFQSTVECGFLLDYIGDLNRFTPKPYRIREGTDEEGIAYLTALNDYLANSVVEYQIPRLRFKLGEKDLSSGYLSITLELDVSSYVAEY